MNLPNKISAKCLCLLSFIFLSTSAVGQTQTPINRQELVQRHIINISKFDSLASLSVGNGEFAFTADITGLQTFPDAYAKGVPLGTQSQWGWHRFPNTGNYKLEETLKDYQANGRNIAYPVQWSEAGRKRDAANYLRQNMHRLQLGNIGFELKKKDGKPVLLTDIKNIKQSLNAWTGELKSTFTLENIPVTVFTYSHQEKDLISVRVQSKLLTTGQLNVRVRFPYPTDAFTDVGNNWQNPGKHESSIINASTSSGILEHKLDATTYFTTLNWATPATLKKAADHYYLLSPSTKSEVLEFSALFSEAKPTAKLPDFTATKTNSQTSWKAFWTRGAAVDFSGSTDPRAKELERRIILSQYLTKVNCAGSVPPQETGLVYNSWYGKYHLEMHWWHAAHFALWNRIDLLEKSLNWYSKIIAKGQETAKRQGFAGVRWPKMTDPTGNESPSGVGPFLIWQQPHFIYFAELSYRHHKNQATLTKYKDLVFATADFMASYATYDKEKDRYTLGNALIPAQESLKPEVTFNSPYELAYWHYGLTTAQKWRERLNLPRHPEWNKILNKLSVLAQKDGLYLAAESAPDSYSNVHFMSDHPAVFGALGVLPASRLVQAPVMQRTFDHIWQTWHWDTTWGWDYPLTAMTATRLGLPEKAIDALLMDKTKNTYLPNGHNFQTDRLRIYLPGNGGLLAAVAMMCAGYEGNKIPNPGIPKNGQWKVKWEGLQVMP